MLLCQFVLERGGSLFSKKLNWKLVCFLAFVIIIRTALEELEL